MKTARHHFIACALLVLVSLCGEVQPGDRDLLYAGRGPPRERVQAIRKIFIILSPILSFPKYTANMYLICLIHICGILKQIQYRFTVNFYYFLSFFSLSDRFSLSYDHSCYCFLSQYLVLSLSLTIYTV